jgi:hypothetical protein
VDLASGTQHALAATPVHILARRVPVPRYWAGSGRSTTSRGDLGFGVKFERSQSLARAQVDDEFHRGVLEDARCFDLVPTDIR